MARRQQQQQQYNFTSNRRSNNTAISGSPSDTKTKYAASLPANKPTTSHLGGAKLLRIAAFGRSPVLDRCTAVVVLKKLEWCCAKEKHGREATEGGRRYIFVLTSFGTKPAFEESAVSLQFQADGRPHAPVHEVLGKYRDSEVLGRRKTLAKQQERT